MESEAIHSLVNLSERIDAYMPGLVSIVMPCYNAALYLEEAVESVLQEADIPIELIVIDDGSMDNSALLLSQYGDRIVVLSSDHVGACEARNLGLEVARGEYIYFLDADDVLMKGSLARSRKALEDSNVDVVFSDYVHIDQRGRKLLSGPLPHNIRGFGVMNTVEYIVRKGIGSSAGLYRRKALYGVGGWLDNLPQQQDRALNLRLALAGATFVYVSQIIVSVRVHSGQARISNAKWWQSDPQRFIRIADHFADLIECSSFRTSESLNCCADELQMRAAEAYFYGARDVALMCIHHIENRFPDFTYIDSRSGIRRVLGKQGLLFFLALEYFFRRSTPLWMKRGVRVLWKAR